MQQLAKYLGLHLKRQTKQPTGSQAKMVGDRLSSSLALMWQWITQSKIAVLCQAGELLIGELPKQKLESVDWRLTKLGAKLGPSLIRRRLDL